jgi:hypothetical protein
LSIAQEEFSLMNPRQPLSMVMFRAAVAQLARVARIVAQPGGHLLLLGQAGSGRNGIARLGIFLSGLQTVEINVRQGAFPLFDPLYMMNLIGTYCNMHMLHSSNCRLFLCSRAEKD